MAQYVEIKPHSQLPHVICRAIVVVFMSNRLLREVTTKGSYLQKNFDEAMHMCPDNTQCLSMEAKDTPSIACRVLHFDTLSKLFLIYFTVINDLFAYILKRSPNFCRWANDAIGSYDSACSHSMAEFMRRTLSTLNIMYNLYHVYLMIRDVVGVYIGIPASVQSHP